MRDLFEDIFTDEPLDPVESARRGLRPQMRKRFYEHASVSESEGGHAVLLDERSVKTPARRSLVAQTQALAQAVADEWNAQGEFIEPAMMPLTRLANTIIDGVADAQAEVKAEVQKYLGTDLVCYRADKPPRLVARQAEQWDPILTWAREQLGARFVLGEGVMHVAQPDGAVAAAATAIPSNVWRLGAVSAIMTLTGSALIALACATGRLDVNAAWTAAHVDEDWNMELWGRDDMAMQRRAFRFAEMQAAGTVIALAGPET